MVIGQIAAQERQVRLSPFRDQIIIVAIADRAAHHQKKHFRQRMSHPPRLTRILYLAKTIEQRPQTRCLKPFKQCVKCCWCDNRRTKLDNVNDN